MKKTVNLLTIVMIILLLSGCVNQHTTGKLEKVFSEATNNEKLNKYLVSIDYKETERSEQGEDVEYYWYDITGILSDEFDELSHKEQYEFFASIVNLVQKNGGSHEVGEFFCGDEIECNIGHIDLNTSQHKYGVEYYPDSTSDLFFVDGEIVYDESAEDGNYTDPLKKDEETAMDTEISSNTVDSQEETYTESASSEDSYSSSDNADSEIKTYTGADWVNLSFDEKFITVQTIIEAMNSGGSTVTADAYWFIEALNAYYGDGQNVTASDQVIEVMSMSGVAGGVIE